MRFTLYYRGPLPSNGSPTDKHFIREAIHPQIVQVWSIPPLDGIAHIHLNPDDKEHNLFTEVNGHLFGCIVSSKNHCTADLDITLLRPEAPGALLAQGGDIDNRLKTLLEMRCLYPRAQISFQHNSTLDRISLHSTVFLRMMR